MSGNKTKTDIILKEIFRVEKKIDLRFDDLRGSFNELQGAVDAYAQKADTYLLPPAILILAIILPGLFGVLQPQKASANGAVIWSVSNTTYGDFSYVNGIAVDGSGVYVGGNQSVWNAGTGTYDVSLVMEKRDLSNGSIIPGWNFIENNGGNIKAVAVDSGGVYFAGSISNGPFDSQWQIKKRNLSTGANIWTWTRNQGDDVSGYSESVEDIAVDTSGLYIAGAEPYAGPFGGSMRWRVEKRSTITPGNVIWSTATQSDNFNIVPSRIFLDGTGVYITGFAGNEINIQKRDLNTGALIYETSTSVDAVSNNEGYVTGSDSRKYSLPNGPLIYSRYNGEAGDNFFGKTSILDSTGIYAVTSDHVQKRRLSDGNLIWRASSTYISGNYKRTAVDSFGLYVVGGSWNIEKRAKFTSTIPPTAATNPASTVRATKATLNGSLNPQDSATPGWFRYSTANPGTCNDTFGTRSPAFDSSKSFGGGSILVGTGTSSVPFSQLITGLTTSTTYYFCAIAENHNGKVLGSVLSFTTTDLPRGDLTSSIFDTQFGGGVVPNTISWKGFLPAGALVYFKIASATSSAPGSWNFIGPNGTAFTTYTPTGPDQPIRINGLNHLNHRFFRYKIYLESDVNENDSPRVDDVFFNLSP